MFWPGPLRDICHGWKYYIACTITAPVDTTTVETLVNQTYIPPCSWSVSQLGIWAQVQLCRIDKEDLPEVPSGRAPPGGERDAQLVISGDVLGHCGGQPGCIPGHDPCYLQRFWESSWPQKVSIGDLKAESRSRLGEVLAATFGPHVPGSCSTRHSLEQRLIYRCERLAANCQAFIRILLYTYI